MTHANVNLDRRTLLKAAGGGLALTALGGVAGCTSGGSEGGTDRPNIDPSKRVDLPEPTPSVLYPEPYVGPKAYDRKPFADGTKTFRVVVPTETTEVGDWNKNKFSAWMEERTGVKIEYQAVNITAPEGGQDLSKINAMLSAGDLPDAFMSIGFSPAQISLYGQQGIFQDLTALIETYAPMERQMMSDVDTIRQTMTARDGKIYQYASINDCYHCRAMTSKAFINQAYLDKIGADMPETTDDFRNVLLELKERNPSGKDGFLPFLSSIENPMDVWFVNPFTYNPGQPWMRLNDGQVEFVASTDGWRQGMALMRSLYDDGTLTKQSFSIDSIEAIKLGDQGLIGCARALYWGQFVSIDYSDNARWYQYQPVMPLQGPSGNRTTSKNYFVTPVHSLVITSACESPELLVQWADYQMDLEAILRAFPKGGVPGKQWDYAEEGMKGLDGRQAIWTTMSGQQGQPVGNGWKQLSLMYRSLDERNGQYNNPDAPNFEADLFQVQKDYEEFAQPMEQQLPPLIFDETSTATISDLESTIQNHVTVSMAKFATAELDINDDATWNDYVSTLDKMGMSQYLEIYQKTYDERPQ